MENIEKCGKAKQFENKAELIEFIKKQTNVELKNIDGFCGDNPDLLYAEMPREDATLCCPFVKNMELKQMNTLMADIGFM